MLPSEEIKEKINIVDLVGEYVQLKKAGVNYRALCPFHHEKSGSFMVSPAKQIWHCFGCGLGGDIFEFVKQMEGVEFPEALEILASRAGVTLRRPDVSYQPDQKKVLYEINNWGALYYSKVLAESKAAQTARDYLTKRGLKPETIKQWQIGYAPDDFHAFENFIVKKGYQRSEVVAAGLIIKKDPSTSSGPSANDYFDRFRDRIMFPIFDLHGRVVGFTGRTLKAEVAGGPAIAKYVNSPETAIYNKSRVIYGLHLAKTEIRRKDEVIIVEGNVDVITCHEAGYSNVVGSSGTALTVMQLESLKRFTENVSFALDADEAGLAALRRAVELALQLGFNVKVIAIPKTLAKDPDELIRKDTAKWEELVSSAQNFLDFYFQEIFAKMDLQSNIGKKHAARELLPLLALLPDHIDRAHYAQKLATTLGVDEKVIIDLLNKQSKEKLKPAHLPKADQSGKPPLRQKSNQELLEARVLGFILRFPAAAAADLQELAADDFTIPLYREIFENRLPAHQVEIDLLMFGLENEISLASNWDVEAFRKVYISRLRFETLKRKMQELSGRIRQAEQSGKFEEVKNLSLQFNNLARELSKFHI